MKPSRQRLEVLLSLPSLAWLTLFFVAPAALVFLLAVRPADAQGGVGPGWTADHLRSLTDSSLVSIYWRTLWIGGATAIISLMLAVPVSLAIARARGARRHVLLLLVIIPFWTSFLIRVFAWKSLLHPQGIISKALQALHLLDDGAVLLYNNVAVLLVMIYTQLPFAILPLYAAAEKFDFSLLESARDLGATRWQAFVSVFLPGIRSGLAAAALMVFVSAIGMYVIPDIVGGTDTELIGNKIAQRVQGDRNLPQAAALSAAMLAAVMALLVVGWWWKRRTEGRTEAAA